MISYNRIVASDDFFSMEKRMDILRMCTLLERMTMRLLDFQFRHHKVYLTDYNSVKLSYLIMCINLALRTPFQQLFP